MVEAAAVPFLDFHLNYFTAIIKRELKSNTNKFFTNIFATFKMKSLVVIDCQEQLMTIYEYKWRKFSKVWLTKSKDTNSI